jgi:hypothetical protein
VNFKKLFFVLFFLILICGSVMANSDVVPNDNTTSQYNLYCTNGSYYFVEGDFSAGECYTIDELNDIFDNIDTGLLVITASNCEACHSLLENHFSNIDYLIVAESYSGSFISDLRSNFNLISGLDGRGTPDSLDISSGKNFYGYHRTKYLEFLNSLNSVETVSCPTTPEGVLYEMKTFEVPDDLRPQQSESLNTFYDFFTTAIHNSPIGEFDFCLDIPILYENLKLRLKMYLDWKNQTSCIIPWIEDKLDSLDNYVSESMFQKEILACHLTRQGGPKLLNNLKENIQSSGAEVNVRRFVDEIKSSFRNNSIPDAWLNEGYLEFIKVNNTKITLQFNKPNIMSAKPDYDFEYSVDLGPNGTTNQYLVSKTILGEYFALAESAKKYSNIIDTFLIKGNENSYEFCVVSKDSYFCDSKTMMFTAFDKLTWIKDLINKDYSPTDITFTKCGNYSCLKLQTSGEEVIITRHDQIYNLSSNQNIELEEDEESVVNQEVQDQVEELINSFDEMNEDLAKNLLSNPVPSNIEEVADQISEDMDSLEIMFNALQNKIGPGASIDNLQGLESQFNRYLRGLQRYLNWLNNFDISNLSEQDKQHLESALAQIERAREKIEGLKEADQIFGEEFSAMDRKLNKIEQKLKKLLEQSQNAGLAEPENQIIEPLTGNTEQSEEEKRVERIKRDADHEIGKIVDKARAEPSHLGDDRAEFLGIIGEDFVKLVNLLESEENIGDMSLNLRGASAIEDTKMTHLEGASVESLEAAKSKINNAVEQMKKLISTLRNTRLGSDLDDLLIYLQELQRKVIQKLAEAQQRDENLEKGVDEEIRKLESNVINMGAQISTGYHSESDSRVIDGIGGTVENLEKVVDSIQAVKNKIQGAQNQGADLETKNRLIQEQLEKVQEQLQGLVTNINEDPGSVLPDDQKATLGYLIRKLQGLKQSLELKGFDGLNNILTELGTRLNNWKDFSSESLPEENEAEKGIQKLQNAKGELKSVIRGNLESRGPDAEFKSRVAKIVARIIIEMDLLDIVTQIKSEPDGEEKTQFWNSLKTSLSEIKIELTILEESLADLPSDEQIDERTKQEAEGHLRTAIGGINEAVEVSGIDSEVAQQLQGIFGILTNINGSVGEIPIRRDRPECNPTKVDTIDQSIIDEDILDISFDIGTSQEITGLGFKISHTTDTMILKLRNLEHEVGEYAARCDIEVPSNNNTLKYEVADLGNDDFIKYFIIKNLGSGKLNIKIGKGTDATSATTPSNLFTQVLDLILKQIEEAMPEEPIEVDGLGTTS